MRFNSHLVPEDEIVSHQNYKCIIVNVLHRKTFYKLGIYFILKKLTLYERTLSLLPFFWTLDTTSAKYSSCSKRAVLLDNNEVTDGSDGFSPLMDSRHQATCKYILRRIKATTWKMDKYTIRIPKKKRKLLTI